MNYFAECTTIDEAKKHFYDLAKIHHPDKGGDTATFQDILNQFQAFRPGEGKEKFKGETDQFNGMEYAVIISQLITIPKIVIEICGSWIWLSNTTKEDKEIIEAIKAVTPGDSYKRGFSGKKEMWYFSPSSYRKFSKKEFSIDEIRGFWGSTRVNKKEREKIAA